MALMDEDLKEMQKRLAELREEYQRLNRSLPEMLDLQEMLVDELDRTYTAMSEIYGYAIGSEQDPKAMHERLQRILRVAGNTLGIKSHIDYTDKFREK